MHPFQLAVTTIYQAIPYLSEKLISHMAEMDQDYMPYLSQTT